MGQKHAWGIKEYKKCIISVDNLKVPLLQNEGTQDDNIKTDLEDIRLRVCTDYCGVE